MTPAELAELARLEAAATPGPWRWLDDETVVRDEGARPVVLTAHPELHLAVRGTGGFLERMDRKCPDAALIVAARNALPALLQEIERLRTTEGLIEHNDFRAIAEANAARLVAARERESRLRDFATMLLQLADANEHFGYAERAAIDRVRAAMDAEASAALTAEGKP